MTDHEFTSRLRKLRIGAGEALRDRINNRRHAAADAQRCNRRLHRDACGVADLSADKAHHAFGDRRHHFASSGGRIVNVFVDDNVAVAADIQCRRVREHDLRRTLRRRLHPFFVDDIGADSQRTGACARRCAGGIEIDCADAPRILGFSGRDKRRRGEQHRQKRPEVCLFGK